MFEGELQTNHDFSVMIYAFSSPSYATMPRNRDSWSVLITDHTATALLPYVLASATMSEPPLHLL